MQICVNASIYIDIIQYSDCIKLTQTCQTVFIGKPVGQRDASAKRIPHLLRVSVQLIKSNEAASSEKKGLGHVRSFLRKRIAATQEKNSFLIVLHFYVIIFYVFTEEFFRFNVMLSHYFVKLSYFTVF